VRVGVGGVELGGVVLDRHVQPPTGGMSLAVHVTFAGATGVLLPGFVTLLLVLVPLLRLLMWLHLRVGLHVGLRLCTGIVAVMATAAGGRRTMEQFHGNEEVLRLGSPRTSTGLTSHAQFLCGAR